MAAPQSPWSEQVWALLLAFPPEHESEAPRPGYNTVKQQPPPQSDLAGGARESAFLASFQVVMFSGLERQPISQCTQWVWKVDPSSRL